MLSPSCPGKEEAKISFLGGKELLEGWVSQRMSQLTGRDGCDGELLPWLVAESPELYPFPEATPLGASPAILRGSPGVLWEVPMFGSVAQNSHGCSRWGSGRHLLLGNRVARGSQGAVNNAHSSPVTNQLSSLLQSSALHSQHSTLCMALLGSIPFPLDLLHPSFSHVSLDNESLGNLPPCSSPLCQVCPFASPWDARGQEAAGGHPRVLVTPGFGSQGFAAGAQGCAGGNHSYRGSALCPCLICRAGVLPSLSAWSFCTG